jgi:ribosomal protein L11 methyltransferase
VCIFGPACGVPACHARHIKVSTIRLAIRLPEHLHELLLAELSELDFEAFEVENDTLLAYAPAARWDDVRREHLERALYSLGQALILEEELIPDTNWNARWEASIQPIDVPPFLIKPSWHPLRPEYEGRIVLEIDPKMSFGTGYHASTRLALGFLPALVRGGECVLDAGCGTGILALAALKLGAARAIGFDIDPWARTNAEENAERNGLADRFDIREGSLEVVPEHEFDLVLANINRNALIDLLPDFHSRLIQGGHLVLAGLLTEDRETMLRHAADSGFHLLSEATEDDWWAAAARRDEG